MKKYFDSLINTSGAPVVAASISVYNYGTTTLASLFADAAGATTLANPLTSSSAGYFEFYAADGRYTLSISVGGYPVTTISDILLDDPTNASATVVVGGSVDNSPIGASTPSSGRFTTLAASGNATLGDEEATDTHAIKGATTVLANSASPALKVTQTGAGNAFVVEDTTSTDVSPFVIDASGRVILGNPTVITGSQLETHGVTDVFRFSVDAVGQSIRFFKSRGTAAAPWTTIVASGDIIGSLDYYGADGTGPILAARITASVDGTPGTNDMPGRLVFSTTADGANVPTERLRIDSGGNVLVSNPAGLGYGTGAGGTVTQATSRTTGVTLNKPTGAITLVSAAGSTSWQSFTVTNSVVAATDCVQVSQKSGTDKYMIHVTNVAAGSFQITFATTGGTTTEQPVFNFAVIKGATS